MIPPPGDLHEPWIGAASSLSRFPFMGHAVEGGNWHATHWQGETRLFRSK